jgi:hypothetical protein
MSVTDEEMQELLASSRTYTLMVLRDGPAMGSPETPGLIWEHGRRNLGLKGEGRMPVVCAVDDDTDLCGVAVLDMELEEARRLMEGDPGVQAGIFSYELHTTRSFPGSGLR